MDFSFDCIFVPGGGLLPDGTLPPWTIARLDSALALADQTEWIATLSGGTVHKPPILDKAGYPIFESRKAAEYLINAGFKPTRLLTEISSYDSIGNAYFSRVLFSDPLSLSRLHVITSAFHMPRIEAIFRWVYALAPRKHSYSLSFEDRPDQGLSPKSLQARLLREKQSLEKLQGKIQQIATFDLFQRWFYSEHAAYTATGFKEKLSNSELESY